MVFDYNVLEAYDKDGIFMEEFTEYEDAAKFYYAHNKECEILLHNRILDTYFVVPEDELQLQLTEE